MKNHLKLLFITDYLCSMLLDLYLPCSENFSDDAILISNEGRTDGTHCRLAIHLFLAISA